MWRALPMLLCVPSAVADTALPPAPTGSAPVELELSRLDQDSLRSREVRLWGDRTECAESSFGRTRGLVSFAPGSDAIGEGRDDLPFVADTANDGNRDTIYVHGFAAVGEDAPGPLAERRAGAVVEALVAAGAPRGRLQAVGHGARRPAGGD